MQYRQCSWPTFLVMCLGLQEESQNCTTTTPRSTDGVKHIDLVKSIKSWKIPYRCTDGNHELSIDLLDTHRDTRAIMCYVCCFRTPGLHSGCPYDAVDFLYSQCSHPPFHQWFHHDSWSSLPSQQSSRQLSRQHFSQYFYNRSEEPQNPPTGSPIKASAHFPTSLPINPSTAALIQCSDNVAQ